MVKALETVLPMPLLLLWSEPPPQREDASETTETPHLGESRQIYAGQCAGGQSGGPAPAVLPPWPLGWSLEGVSFCLSVGLAVPSRQPGFQRLPVEISPLCPRGPTPARPAPQAVHMLQGLPETPLILAKIAPAPHLLSLPESGRPVRRHFPVVGVRPEGPSTGDRKVQTLALSRWRSRRSEDMHVEPRSPNDQAALSPFPLMSRHPASSFPTPDPRPRSARESTRAGGSLSLPAVPRRRMPLRTWRAPRVLGPLSPVRALDRASLWSLSSAPRAARRQPSLSHLLSSALPIRPPLHCTDQGWGRERELEGSGGVSAERGRGLVMDVC